MSYELWGGCAAEDWVEELHKKHKVLRTAQDAQNGRLERGTHMAACVGMVGLASLNAESRMTRTVQWARMVLLTCRKIRCSIDNTSIDLDFTFGAD